MERVINQSFGLFTGSYKYIIDASSILSQKNDEQNRRIVLESLWDKIDSLVQNRIIVTCSEIADEAKKDDFIQTIKWVKQTNCVIIEVDYNIQENVIEIVSAFPDLIDFSKSKNSGDAFLLATAKKYALTVITEENKEKKNKIPMIAKALQINAISLMDMCAVEGLKI
ncbi:MAG: DUF4411 family protein [Deltaproteobacteria bacterium]|jgi:uncharacterized protein with PIN domain|nr:DUF4411 family protein [Deltaproteobacteria bacterium]